MRHYFIMPFSLSLSIDVYAKKLAYGRPWERFCQPLVDRGWTEDDAYHAFLYSEERMAHKFASFEKIALARILETAREHPEWRLLIYVTADVMPPTQLTRLRELTRDIPQVDITSVPKGGIFHEMCDHYRAVLDKSDRYSTIRVDDDDGVPRDLLRNVETFAAQIPGPFLYTTPRICTVALDSAGTLNIGDVGEHPSQAASGMAAVDTDVYMLGTHTTIAARHPGLKIVRDHNADPILMSCHEDHCISLRKFVNKFSGFTYPPTKK